MQKSLAKHGVKEKKRHRTPNGYAPNGHRDTLPRRCPLAPTRSGLKFADMIEGGVND
jgi:hypothetical protein